MSTLLNVLKTSLAVGAVSALLAAVIAVIDVIVNNYGDVRIDINRGKKKLTVKGGLSLLTLLGQEGIFLPSACGGRATCGVCKVKLLSRNRDHLPTELPFMTEQEMNDNIRLSCQIKVKSDLQIEIPEELFSINRYDTTVTSIREVTHDIRELTCTLNHPPEMDFKAGQYAQIVIPPYENNKTETQRAYSIASVPGKKNTLQFLIRLVPGGMATTYVFTRLKEGSRLELVGPMGDFYLRETDSLMICIAGGSGMAPIKSILFDMFESGRTRREVWYFFGALSVKDLYYSDMFRELEEKWPAFHFVPALSNPDPSDKWRGETGLITEVVRKYLAEVIETAVSKEGYLCGSPGMIDASIEVLKAGGIKESDIYYDKFA